MKDNRSLLLRVLTQSNYIQLNKDLIKALGLEKAAVLGDMISFDSYLKDKGKDEEGWFYYTYEDLNESLCLSKYQLMNATNDLEELKILESKKQGVPCRKYYKINYDIITLIITEIPQKLKNFTTGSKKTLPLAVKDLNHLLYITNNTTNNKNIDLSKDSDESLNKRPKGLLKSSNKKLKTPIENNKEFRAILEMWNSFPLATRHNRLDTKTVEDAFKWFKALGDGTFFRKASKMTAAWMKENNIPLEWQTKAFTFEEIEEGVRRLGLQFLPGYWPYLEEEKKKYLPKSLSAAFYSPYNTSCPSAFLKVMANEPKGEATLNEEESEKYDKYFKIYEEKLDIRSKDKPKIAKHIKAVLYQHRCMCESCVKVDGVKLARVIIEEELGTNFLYAVGDIYHPDTLISNHRDFLKECKSEWNKFKLTPSSFSPHGALWEKFIEWMEDKYKIKIWLNSEEESYLAMRYGNYKKEKGRSKSLDSNTKKRIRELKRIIKSEKSEDVKMLFEEELEKLREDLKKDQEVV